MGNTSCSSRRDCYTAVHPHACGEHITSNASARAVNGSSPRLWGTQCSSRLRRLLTRFIPTPVGNTAVLTESGGAVTVHPHACGEHGHPQGHRILFHGSSPRLWGTHQLLRWQDSPLRFIPTPVGNTDRQLVSIVKATVHPHACGEHPGIGST